MAETSLLHDTPNSKSGHTVTELARASTVAASLAASLTFLSHVLDNPDTCEGTHLSGEAALGLAAILGCLEKDAYMLLEHVQGEAAHA